MSSGKLLLSYSYICNVIRRDCQRPAPSHSVQDSLMFAQIFQHSVHLFFVYIANHFKICFMQLFLHKTHNLNHWKKYLCTSQIYKYLSAWQRNYTFLCKTYTEKLSLTVKSKYLCRLNCALAVHFNGVGQWSPFSWRDTLWNIAWNIFAM